jgi:hypothetical protein
MEKLLLVVAFTAINIMDAVGYSYRHKQLTCRDGLTKTYSLISHAAQAAVLFMMLLLIPFATTFDAWKTFTTWETAREIWFVIYAMACTRFLVYDITYNLIQGTHYLYDSDSSITGKIKMMLSGLNILSPTTIFIFRIFIFIIPFAEAINSI